MEPFSFDSKEKLVKIQVHLLEPDIKYGKNFLLNGTYHTVDYTKITDTQVRVRVSIFTAALMDIVQVEVLCLEKQLYALEFALKSTQDEIEKLRSEITTAEILQQLLADNDGTVLTLMYTENTLKTKISELKQTHHLRPIALEGTLYEVILSAGQIAHISDMHVELRDTTVFPEVPVCISPSLSKGSSVTGINIMYLQSAFVVRGAIGSEIRAGISKTIIGYNEDGSYKFE